MVMRLPCLALLLWCAGAVDVAAQDTPFTFGETAGCFSCHAVDPASLAAPRYPPPKIAGQRADYLASAIRDYREGRRSHYLMNSPASEFAEDEIEPLTAYIAGITADQLPHRVKPEPDPAAVARGEQLAAASCVRCHPRNGGGGRSGTPSLNGQYAAYLLVTLQDYRLGVRHNPAMLKVTSALSDDEMADLAAFYASLTGLYPY